MSSRYITTILNEPNTGVREKIEKLKQEQIGRAHV